LQTLWRSIEEEMPPEVGCSKCFGGIVRTPKDGFGLTASICDCSIERENILKVIKLLGQSNLPNLKRHFRLSEWNMPGELDFDFLDVFSSGIETGKKGWLYIRGNAGTGKTFLATVLARLALMKERSVYFSDTVSLMDILRPDVSNAHLEVKQLLEDVDLLILDDIGHEKSSQWVREQLYKIINHRWSKGLQVILTSNFEIERLKETVSEAVYSRVKGFSLEIPIVNSKDLRL